MTLDQNLLKRAQQALKFAFVPMPGGQPAPAPGGAAPGGQQIPPEQLMQLMQEAEKNPQLMQEIQQDPNIMAQIQQLLASQGGGDPSQSGAPQPPPADPLTGMPGATPPGGQPPPEGGQAPAAPAGPDPLTGMDGGEGLDPAMQGDVRFMALKEAIRQVLREEGLIGKGGKGGGQPKSQSTDTGAAAPAAAAAAPAGQGGGDIAQLNQKFDQLIAALSAPPAPPTGGQPPPQG